MQRPTLVLPTPGAPTKHSMGPDGEGGGEREREREQVLLRMDSCGAVECIWWPAGGWFDVIV